MNPCIIREDDIPLCYSCSEDRVALSFLFSWKCFLLKDNSERIPCHPKWHWERPVSWERTLCLWLMTSYLLSQTEKVRGAD